MLAARASAAAFLKNADAVFLLGTAKGAPARFWTQTSV